MHVRAARSRCRRISSRGWSARSSSPSPSTRAAWRCASRTCPGKAHLTQFALDVGSFAIRFFADYYGIPYPGEKCDLVALPDFSFGAMENLGCVTFREARLLARSRAGDAHRDVRRRAHDRARDRAHVVRRSRDHEVVERHLAQRGVRDVHGAPRRRRVPTRRGRPGTTSRSAAPAALDVDALSNTRTVEYEVITPEDADGMFDLLTYQKGGSVLRMLERWLGADAFRAGVRALSRSLPARQHRDHRPVGLVGVGDERARAPDHGLVDLPARLPARDGASATAIGHDHPGAVRLRGRDAEHAAVGDPGARARARRRRRADDALLAARRRPTPRSTLPPTRSSCSTPGGEGFYRVVVPARVARPPARRGRALGRSNGSRSSTTCWAAVLAGTRQAAELLALARQLRDEDDLVVWRVLVERAARRRLGSSTATRSDALRAEVGDVLAPTFSRLGWQPAAGEDARTRQLRGVVLDALGTLVEDPAVIASGARDSTRAEQRRSRRRVGVGRDRRRRRRRRHVRRVRRRVRDAAPTPQEQLRYLYALGHVPDRGARAARGASTRCRTRCGRRTGRSCSSGRCATASTARRSGCSCATTGTTLRGRFSGSLMPRLLDGVTWLVDDASLADVPTFLADHPVPEGARVIAQHLERQRVHRAVVDRERERLSAALLDR